MAKSGSFNTTLSKGVTLPSVIFILLVSIIAGFFPDTSESALEVVKKFIFEKLNWILVWAVTIFIIFLLYLMFSKFGSTRLGPNNSKPDHSFFSWVAMLFAAGMGIGLMYFSVAEPMSHYLADAFADEGSVERQRNALMYTSFHWGVHAWSIYALVGLGLAYFSYRYKLPLSLRSCLYPLLGNKIGGKWGNVIDIFAFCSTFFGIVLSLGFGVVQVNAGLEQMGIVPGVGIEWQILIVVVLVSCSVISATSGVDKGIKNLSNANMVGVIALMIFVLIFGPTTYLIGSFTEGVGDYISNFFTMTFNTHIHSPDELPWFYDWTILYWAWWISWSPFVGLFIAKVSRGRTIREYIAAVLLLPALFNIIWFAIMGNTGIWIDNNIADGALGALVDNQDALAFEFLKYLPATWVLSALFIIIIIIFFVTSADSGILVMDSIATKDAKYSPKWQKITMGALLALLSLVLLNAGGLDALQTMTLITAVPFTIIIFLFIASLAKALMIDKTYFDQYYPAYTAAWSGGLWKDRLKQMVGFTSDTTVDQFIRTTAHDAFEELKKEFEEHDIKVKIRTSQNPEQIEFVIAYDQINDFLYGIKTESTRVPDYVTHEKNIPDSIGGMDYIAQAYFGDYRRGYDTQFFTKKELIADMLKHYERYLDLISKSENELFVSINANANKLYQEEVEKEIAAGELLGENEVEEDNPDKSEESDESTED